MSDMNQDVLQYSLSSCQGETTVLNVVEEEEEIQW
jgi:hypothetical protein